MRYSHYILTFLFILGINQLKSQRVVKTDSIFANNQYRDTTIQKYVVKKITKVKNGSIILIANRNDSIERCFNLAFTIGKKKGKSKIKVGSSYYFKIYAYYEHDMFLDDGMIYEIVLNGKTIKVPPNQWRSNVFISPDLEKLFYVRR